MSSESGFESFDWRGKLYNTEELRKKFGFFKEDPKETIRYECKKFDPNK